MKLSWNCIVIKRVLDTTAHKKAVMKIRQVELKDFCKKVIDVNTNRRV